MMRSYHLSLRHRSDAKCWTTDSKWEWPLATLATAFARDAIAGGTYVAAIVVDDTGAVVERIGVMDAVEVRP